MKKNIKAESLAGVIIWIFILGITLIGIGNIVSFSQESIYETKLKTDILSLQRSANILKNHIDSSHIQPGETFYLYKNVSGSSYDVFTGATNETYKHIDVEWNWVSDISNFSWVLFSREFVLETRITTEYWEKDFLDFNIKPVTNR